ncbi:unnamed protein product [Cochlearia groenlandica]
MEHRDVVSWNTIVTKCLAHGHPCKSLNYFKWMAGSGQEADSVTISCVISACASLEELFIGESLHGFAIKSGYVPEAHVSVANSIISMYSKCGDMEAAETLFEEVLCKDVISWNAILSGFASNEMVQEVFGVLKEMQLAGSIQPDITTVVTVTSLCSEICLPREGLAIHGYTVRREMQSRAIEVRNSLIDMYGKCGLTRQAEFLFKTATDRDLVSWNSMISAFAQNGFAQEAKNLFKEVLFRNLKLEPNEITFVGLLSASTQLGSTSYGMQAHCNLIRRGFQANPFVCTALVDMYSSCGMLETGLKVFRNLGAKSISAWNSLISAYGFHGMGEKAIDLFNEMISGSSSSNSRMEPNKSTFISLLSACSHSGFIDKGLSYYNQMEEKFGVKPVTEHRVCIVDMLGRAGKLREAYDFIAGIDEPKEAGVWGALLSACNYHEDTKLGKEVAEVLFEMEPDNASYYISLSNTYVGLGGWEEAVRLRKMVEDNALNKVPGYSVIDVR